MTKRSLFPLFAVLFARVVALVTVLISVGESAEISFSMVEFKDKTHLYYHELLTEALSAKGHHLSILSQGDVPQKRIVNLIRSGGISLHWFLKADSRERLLVPIRVGLTGGLIGQRVFFIPAGAQEDFDGVSTLAELQRLEKVGAFGAGWFDAKVWRANNLRFSVVDGDWRRIYKMLERGSRNIDYFSRGVTEILAEAKIYPYLAIEKRLLLIYDRDFYFYLAPSQRHLQPVLEEALKMAKSSGLMARLIKKHWGEDLEKLRLKRRIKILLKTPLGS